jgi:ATP phosphoribosyltransferase regulatory subunit HisZ
MMREPMIHPIPPGTRDILPDEMRELRELQATLIEVFERYGYGQVATPTLEYDEVLQRGEGRSGLGAYRFFDERGELLALRSDMTIPIARLVATRFADAEPPMRFGYVGNAYRVVRPQRAQVRQFMHAGIELIGSPAPEGTAEVLEVLSVALDAVGLNRAVLGLGDADLYRQLLTELGVDGERGTSPRSACGPRPVGLEMEVDAIDGLDEKGARRCSGFPGCAVGRRSSIRPVSSASGGRARDAAASGYVRLAGGAGSPAGAALDLSLLRDLGYYTGAIVEIYDPALGHILGGVAATTTCSAGSAGRSGGRIRPLPGAGPPRPDGGGARCARAPRRRSRGATRFKG